MSNDPVRVGMIGAGLMARYHLATMLPRDDTVVVAVCEPSDAAFAVAAAEFTSRGLAAPPNEPDWERFVEHYAPELDAVFIITPHVFHAAQTTACLEGASTSSSKSRWSWTRPRRRR
jgi:predicted dehydrogenase